MTDPYYAAEEATLHLGNCLDILPTLPDASVDAVVCDPPYNLSDSRKRDTDCLRRILAEFLLPHLNHGDSQDSQGADLSGPPLSGSLLSREYGSVRVHAGVRMPEGAVDFESAAVVEHEVDAGDVASARPSDGYLPPVSDPQGVQSFGGYILQLADSGDASFCDGTCSCFAEPSPGLIAVTVALPGTTGSDLLGALLGSQGRSNKNIGLLDYAERQSDGSPLVVAGAGAVVGAVLRLDLTRRTGELRLADGAHEGRPLLLLTPAQPVGAGSGAGGLTSMSKTGLVSLVGDSADGAFSLHFPWHDVNSSRQGRGFMGKEWDGWDSPAAYQRWCLAWARECHRVLKPGGHLLAFGGTRTYHRMTVAIEDAGFEIRDSLHWIYGGGFPKGIDVAKAVDRVGGSSPKQQATILKQARQRAEMTVAQVAAAIGCTVTSVRDWEDGRARAAGREVEHIVPSPAYRERLADLLGYSADERRIVGASTRLRTKDGPVFQLGYSGVEYGEATTDNARAWSGWNTALKPAHEPIVLARKLLAGTVATNVLEHGTGALNVDGCRTEAGQNYREKCASVVGIASPRNGDTLGDWTGTREDSAHDAGRWPTNNLLGHGPDCGDTCSRGCPVPEVGAESRFFPVFRYEAKAPASERPRLADGTAHTTVKPLALMRWLVRLVTPPGGTVLDPFAGTGTTLAAALREGMTAIGIEQHEPYAQLAVQRLSEPYSAALFG